MHPIAELAWAHYARRVALGAFALGVIIGCWFIYSAYAAPATFSDWINTLTTSTADGTTYTREGSTGKKIAHDDANTASTLVRRDASGNFAAGTITATLTGNASGNAGTVTFADAGGDTTTSVALGTAATGSLAPATDAGLTYDASTNILTVAGGVTGTASLATALAANGANCSAGQAPLGVDESGAVESCTAYAAAASPTFTGSVGGPSGSAGTPGYAFSADPDTGLYNTAGNVFIGTDGTGRLYVNSGGLNFLVANTYDILNLRSITNLNGSVTQQAPTGSATHVYGQVSEAITLSTSGTTTDSTANLLPAGSIIQGVACRVTTTITTATDWSVGDGTTAARFGAANSTMTAGATTVGLQHHQGSVSTDAAGPVQAAAAKLRITTTGTPGAGAIRCTVFYDQFTAPTG